MQIRSIKEKEKRDNWKKLNLCLKCGSSVFDNKSMCEYHWNKYKERHNIIRKEKREKGICYDCLQPSVEGKHYCELHIRHHRNKGRLYKNNNPQKVRADSRISSAKMRAQCQTNNICFGCKLSNDRKTLYCSACLLIRNQSKINRMQKRLAEGLCKTCGQNKFVTKEGQQCEICYLKWINRTSLNNEQNYSNLKILLESQNGICPYTGRELILTVNASIDHKIPKSKGGNNNLANLQWVYYGEDFNVNFMKSNYLEQDFLAAIRIIYKYCIT
jgi:hypothetical protein